MREHVVVVLLEDLVLLCEAGRLVLDQLVGVEPLAAAVALPPHATGALALALEPRCERYR